MYLAEVYLDHGEALEYDLLRIWGMDINDPRMTIRRLRNFVDRLPFDSEVVNDVNEIPREARAWDVNTWMLANVLDGLSSVSWHIIATNSKRTPRPPKPYPRPKTKVVTSSKKNMWPGKTIIDKGKING